MNVSDFDYELPDERIAANPPAVRGESRLLVLDRLDGSITDSMYKQVADYLRPNDVLVLNNSKVIKARLRGTKQNGAERELILLERHGRTEDWHTHKVMYRRKIAVGDVITVGDTPIEVVEILGDGLAIVRSSEDLLHIAERHGSVPLPPYMQREATSADIERYQTVWAKEQGSVAAPTASLNMTEQTLESLRAKGVTIAELTLHVGLGTFMPIRVEKLEDHTMHQEYFEVPASTVAAIQAAREQGGRVIALGTTVCRTLEYLGSKLLQTSPQEYVGEADIFMYPGYEFTVVEGLLTNFHAPHSTVLMLTAAFAGWDKLQPAYQHAVSNEYMFFSYGDSMLIV